ncbi:MAG: hypothetical protein C0596_09405 [Marinilabiliales bacterium]|nr:MAG: hypothetical protein C0596_09405 [Marinilabiliales bacterium]
MAIIIFSIINMSVNLVLYIIILGIGVLLLLLGEINRMEINETEVCYYRYFLFGIIKKKEIIKIDEIDKIDYQKAHLDWDDLFTGTFGLVNNGTVSILDKNDVENEFSFLFYPNEVKRIVDILNEQINN